MQCMECGCSAVSERPERTIHGYRRFRCRACGKQFNERSTGQLNRARYPSDVIALVVLWRLRYKLSLRDLAEMFLIRGIVPHRNQHPAGRVIGILRTTDQIILVGARADRTLTAPSLVNAGCISLKVQVEDSPLRCVIRLY